MLRLATLEDMHITTRPPNAPRCCFNSQIYRLDNAVKRPGGASSEPSCNALSNQDGLSLTHARVLLEEQ